MNFLRKIWAWVKRMWHKVLIALGIIAVSTVGYHQVQLAGIPDTLKLKVPPSKVLDSIVQKDKDGDTVLYAYEGNPVQKVKGEVMRNNRSVVRQVGMGLFELTSFVDPVFFHNGTEWTEIGYATTSLQAYQLQASLLVTDIAFAAKASTFSDTGDGLVVNSTAASTWAATHDATTGTLVDTTGANEVVQSSRGAAGTYVIRRLFLPFVTSIIPASAQIRSASVFLHPSANGQDGSGDAYNYFSIVQSWPANYAALALTDFPNIGTTVGSSNQPTLVSMVTTTPYIEFPLDTNNSIRWVKKAGQASICSSTAGITCIGGREAHDLMNVTIPANSTINSVGIASANTAGTGSDPYIRIIYATREARKVIEDN